MQPEFFHEETRHNTGNTLTLRNYQVESVAELRQGIRDGKRNQVLCAPTGSGKSVIATHLIAECFEKGNRALFIVERLPLIDQFSAMLDHFGIPHGCIQGGHWRVRPHARVQVCTAQTLRTRGWPKTDLIIVDEAHVMMKDTLERIERRDCTTIGLTATPFADGMGKFYDGLVSVTTTNKLIADGSLVPFKVFAAVEPNMHGVKTVLGEWEVRETGVRATQITGDVVAEYLSKCPGEKFIAFGVNVDHAIALQSQFMAAGIRCELHTYRDDDVSKDENMEEFRRPGSSITGLVSVSALSRGLDVPDVSCIIMARPLKKSLAEHIQILGRGLRPFPGKAFCTVLDAAGNTVRFWDEMSEFFEHGALELDDGSKKDKPKPKEKVEKAVKCPQCFHVFAGGPFCPACGYEFPRKPAVEHVAGELREFIGGRCQLNAPLSREGQIQLIGELRTMQMTGVFGRPHKPGWVYHKFKDIAGSEPPVRTESVEPRPVSPETKRKCDQLYRKYRASIKQEHLQAA